MRFNTQISIIGGTGFIGKAIQHAAGGDAATISAPRLRWTGPRQGSWGADPSTVEYLSDKLRETTVVINAAGIATPSSTSSPELLGANSLLPMTIAEAAAMAGVSRLVHISSAAVQGRSAQLSSATDAKPLTPYAAAKALGETGLLNHAHSPGLQICVYRPPGVHGHGRDLTASLARFSRSSLSSVAAPGNDPTPQTLVRNVASAALFIARFPTEVPPIVHHPWEGITTSELLYLLSDREPKQIPRVMAEAFVNGSHKLASTSSTRACARRLEILWFGQQQSKSWLTAKGWQPPFGRDVWRTLGAVRG